MSAIIGSVLGFAATIIPEIITMLKDHFAHQRDLEVKQADVSVATAGLTPVAATPNPPTVAPVDPDCQLMLMLKSSVRPMLTYSFFVLFMAVKLISVFHAYHVEHLPTAQALPLLWDEETETLFSAVISFWFGSRALAKVAPNGDQKAPTVGTAESDINADLSGSAHVVGE